MNFKRTIRESISIFLIILSVLAFRSVFYEPFKIPSGSMIPTLLIGDFILVNKFNYGFKVPFSDWFTDPIYITKPKLPKRGDIIVFKYPKDTSINYIKRVVGLPGEKIEIQNKQVFINGNKLEMEHLNGEEILKDMDEKFLVYNFDFFKSKTGDVEHVVQHNIDSFFNSDYHEITIPENHYFVMGDNRDFSSDSRIWGFVPFNYIKGQAEMIWFNFNFRYPWDNQSDDVFVFRPWRIGTSIF